MKQILNDLKNAKASRERTVQTIEEIQTLLKEYSRVLTEMQMEEERRREVIAKIKSELTGLELQREEIIKELRSIETAAEGLEQLANVLSDERLVVGLKSLKKIEERIGGLAGAARELTKRAKRLNELERRLEGRLTSIARLSVGASLFMVSYLTMYQLLPLMFGFGIIKTIVGSLVISLIISLLGVLWLI
jgi:chromosome segregation ATPase